MADFTAEQILAVFPKGLILAWNATSGAIPAGWAVCDGSNGTPDLRGRFLMGVSDFADVGQTPGSGSHNHNFSGTTGTPGGVDNTNVKQEGGSPLTVKGTDHTHGFGGTTGNASNIPPSYTVLYIMKL